MELNSNPEVPQKFPDFPGGQLLALGSLTQSPGSQNLSLRVSSCVCCICVTTFINSPLTVAILAQGHFGSSAGFKVLFGQHRLAQSAKLFLELPASDDGMGPSSGQAPDERTSGGAGGGGEDTPRCTGRGVELYLWVLQFCSSLCMLLLQESQGGWSEPRHPEEPQPEPVKEALDAALERRGRQLQLLSVRHQKTVW